MKEADANACLPSFGEFREWLKWDEGRHPEAPSFCIQVRWSQLAKVRSNAHAILHTSSRRQRDAH